MIEEGWPEGIVLDAVTVMERYPWFVRARITVPPWEITVEHYEQLIEAKPWEKSGGWAGQ